MGRFTISSRADEVAAVFSEHIANKIVLVTGCTPGSLAASAVDAIAAHNPALLILAGRTASSVRTIQETLRAKSPALETRALVFDLADLQSVREAAAEVNSYQEQVDVLIHSAGIMAAPYAKTADGFESHLATNHLGPFLFTKLIIGKIRRGGRIVTVSSLGYFFGGVRFEDPNFETGTYEKWQAYGQSKTANILFAEALGRRIGAARGVYSFSLHPGGAIQTNLSRFMKQEDFDFLAQNPLPMITPQQGASCYIAAAFDPALEARNGSFLEYGEPTPTFEQCPWTRGEENADRLWELSENLLGETFEA